MMIVRMMGWERTKMMEMMVVTTSHHPVILGNLEEGYHESPSLQNHPLPPPHPLHLLLLILLLLIQNHNPTIHPPITIIIIHLPQEEEIPFQDIYPLKSIPL